MTERQMRRALRLGTSGLDTLDEMVLYVQARAGGWEAVLEAILEQMKRRVISAAYKMERAHTSQDDLQQDARTALVEAIDRYDPSAGVPFAGFVYQRMTGAVVTGAGEQTPGFRIPRRQLSTYQSAVTRFGDDFDMVVAYCEARSVSRTTVLAIHNALNGQESLNEDRSTDDAYEGTTEEGASLEADLPFSWDNGPDISVWEALETLSDKQKEALLLYARGVNTVKMGEALGISQAAAHGRAKTGLKNLREFYGRD